MDNTIVNIIILNSVCDFLFNLVSLHTFFYRILLGVSFFVLFDSRTYLYNIVPYLVPYYGKSHDTPIPRILRKMIPKIRKKDTGTVLTVYVR